MPDWVPFEGDLATLTIYSVVLYIMAFATGFIVAATIYHA